MDRFPTPSLLREQIPSDVDARVDYIRHGKPSYEGEDEMSGEVQGHLSPESREVVREQALKFVETIDSKNELVVIYSSPKQRSSQTANVYLEVLKEKGIPCLNLEGKETKGKVKIKPRFRDAQISEEFMSYLLEGVEVGDIEEDSVFSHWAGMDDAEVKEINEERLASRKTDSHEDIRRRLYEGLSIFRRMTRMKKLPGERKFHFLVFGHEELIDPLVVDAFGQGMHKKSGANYGENVTVDLKNVGENEQALRVNFRGNINEIVI